MSLSVKRVINVVSGAVNALGISPFIEGQDIVVRPAGAYHLYSVPGVASGDATRFWAVPVDGTATTFTAPAGLNALNAVAAAGLNNGNRLETIALVNGVPLVQIGNDAGTPASGQFSCADATHITFGDTFKAQVHGHLPYVIVLAFLSGDITDSGALTSGVPKEQACPGFVTSSGAIALEPLAHC